MARFEAYKPIIFSIEGELGKTTNNKDDLGGWTNAGVTIKTFRSFFGQDKTIDDLKKMTLTQWTKIMRSYWDECKADSIKNQSLANLVVDWNINSGISGRKGVQQCLGLVTDGIFGPKTLGALNDGNPVIPFYKVKLARMLFFKELADKKEGQINNLGGWLNRLNSFAFKK